MEKERERRERKFFGAIEIFCSSTIPLSQMVILEFFPPGLTGHYTIAAENT